MTKWDIAFGAALAILGAAMIVVAAGFPAIAGLAVGPSLFPTLIGAGMVLIGSVIAIQTMLAAPDTAQMPLIPPFLSWNLVLISALILFFLAVVDWTGFSIACFAIIFALLRVYHRERLLVDLVLTIVAVLIVFVIFSSVFRVSLPVGPVEKLIFKFI